MPRIAKVIEVIADSEDGFDDAVKSALAEASKTVSNIRSIWVDNLSAVVENNRIVSYRANCKITFLIEGHG